MYIFQLKICTPIFPWLRLSKCAFIWFQYILWAVMVNAVYGSGREFRWYAVCFARMIALRFVRWCKITTARLPDACCNYLCCAVCHLSIAKSHNIIHPSNRMRLYSNCNIELEDFRCTFFVRLVSFNFLNVFFFYGCVTYASGYSICKRQLHIPHTNIVPNPKVN